MKRNFVYLSFAAIAAMTCFTSCIDNEEPASVANLREAAAIKLKAEANKIDMEALVEKAKAAIQDQKAAQEAVVTAEAQLILAQKEAAQDNNKAEAVEAAKAALVKAQDATAKAQAALTSSLAALDGAEKAAIVTKDNNKVILETGLQTALFGAKGAYTLYVAAEKEVIAAQKTVIEAEYKLADAKLNPKTTELTPTAIATLLAEKQTALKAAEKNLADAKAIGTDAEAIAKKCDEITTEVAKLDVSIAAAKAVEQDYDNQITAAKEKIAAEALAVKTAWKKADDKYTAEQKDIQDLIDNDAKTYLAPGKNTALKNKYNWSDQQVSGLLSFDIKDADAAAAKTLADNSKINDTYIFSYTGTDTKGGKLTVNDLFKHHVTNLAVYNKTVPTVDINWKVTGQGADGVDIWTATTATNVVNLLYTSGVTTISDAVDKVRTDAFVDNYEKNLLKAESLAQTKYDEESATRIQNLKAQKQASVVAQKAATKEADDKIEETTSLSTTSSDSQFTASAVKDSAVEELTDKKAEATAKVNSLKAEKTALEGLKTAYKNNLTTVGGESISSLTEAGLAKIIDKLEAAVRDAQVAVDEVENGQYDSVDAAEKALAEAKLTLAQKEAERDEAKKVYEATVEAYK